MPNMDFLRNSAEPWVVYRTLADLDDLKEDDPAVMKARSDMIAHPLVRKLTDELKQWPGTVISSHKSAGQLYHKLEFAADLGLTGYDDGMPDIIPKVMAFPSEEGLLRLKVNIPEHFGGTGADECAWALCDAPLLSYSLAKVGMSDHHDVRIGVRYLAGLARKNGWPCVVSKELGKFRGPGKKDDPCPYASLIILKLMALYDEYRESDEAAAGAMTLLDLWEQSRERHPYMFFMGTDFRKLKAPFIWYDILHFAEVLSQYKIARHDARFAEILGIINAKADQDGLFTPESVWTAWSDWDFGQKKSPSPWLTFLVYRINKRMERI